MNTLYLHSKAAQHKALVTVREASGEITEYTDYCECLTKQGMIII